MDNWGFAPGQVSPQHGDCVHAHVVHIFITYDPQFKMGAAIAMHPIESSLIAQETCVLLVMQLSIEFTVQWVREAKVKGTTFMLTNTESAILYIYTQK